MDTVDGGSLQWGMGLDLTEIERGLNAFIGMLRAGGQAFGQLGREGGAALETIGQVVREADKTVRTIIKDVGDMERAIRTADMSPWAKQADKAAEKIRANQAEVVKLEAALKSVTATEEERLAVTQKIAQVQAEINRLQQAQGKALDLAQLAESSKEVKATVADIDKLFTGLVREVGALNQATSQIGMSAIEKQAATFATRLSEAKATLAELETQSKSLSATDAQRLQIAEKMVEARRQVAALEQAQGQALDSARDAEQKAQATKAEAQALREAEAEAKKLNAVMAESERILTGVEKEARSMATAIKQADMSPAARQADQWAERITALRGAVSGLEHQLTQVNLTEEQQTAITEQLAHAHASLDEAVRRQQGWTQLAKLKEETQASEAAAKQATAAYQKMFQATQDLAQNVRNVAAPLALTLDLGLASIGKEVMDASKETAEFQAVAHASGDEIKYMVDNAKELKGVTTTAAEAASVELSRAGLSAKEAADDLNIFRNVAVAAGEDLSLVSKGVLSTNRAFGQNNSELKRTGDIITAVSNATSTSVAEVVTGMSQMASTSHMFNQSLLDTGIAFGVLRDAGISVESASTGYKNFLQEMVKPSKQAREELNLITKSADGVKEIFRDHGQIRPFADAIADLKDRLSGLSDAARDEVLAKIFTKKSLNIVLAYMGQTEEKLQSTRAEIEKYTDVAQKAADVMDQAMGAKFKQMLKEIENLKLELGDKLAPVLESGIKLVEGLVHAYEGLSPALKTVTAYGIVALAGLANILSVTSQLVITVGGAKMAWEAYSASQVKTTVTGKALAESILAGNTAAESSMALMAGGWLLAITVLVGEVWLAVDAFNSWQKAVENLDQAERNRDEARSKSAGGLNELTGKKADKITDDDLSKASHDTDLTSTESNQSIKDLVSLKSAMQELSALKSGPHDKAMAGVDAEKEREIQGRIESLQHDVKSALHLADDVQLDDIDNMMLSLKNKKTLSANQSSYVSGLSSILTGAAPEKSESTSGLTDADLNSDSEAEKARTKYDREETAKVNAFITAQKLKTDAADKAAEAQIKGLKAVDGQAKATAKSINEIVFGGKGYAVPGGGHFGDQRNGYPHEGLDMQAKGDYEKPHGSPVFAPDDVKVLSTSITDHGAIVALQSLVDKAVVWKMMHLSPSDVTKNIKAGQEFSAGQAMNVRVGGKDDINVGPHWAGVHLHLQKEVNGNPVAFDPSKPVMVDGSKNEVENLKQQQIELQKAINLQKTLKELRKKAAEIAADPKLGTDSKAYTAINNEITRVDTALQATQTKAGEYAKKAAEARKTAEDKANQEIAKLREQHEQAQIALMEEGEAKIEEQRKAELNKNHDDLLKALADTKLALGADEKLKAGYQQKDADTNAKYNKALLDLREKYSKSARDADDKIEEGRIAAMNEGLPKQLAELRFGLKKQLDSYDDQEKELIKLKRERSQEFKGIEAQRTQTTESAAKKRQELILQNQAETAAASRDFLEGMLSDEQKAFESSLQELIQSKKKIGLSVGQVAGSLKAEDFLGLAQSLGQDSPDDLLANLKQQVKVIETETAAQEALNNKRDHGSANYKAQQKAINEEKKQEQQIQALINVLSDEDLRKQLKKYQEALKHLKETQDAVAAIQNTYQNATDLVNIFKSGFQQLLGEATQGFSTITDGVIGMGKGIVDTFTNPIAGAFEIFSTLLNTTLNLVNQNKQAMQEYRRELQQTGILAADAVVQQKRQELEAAKQNPNRTDPSEIAAQTKALASAEADSAMKKIYADISNSFREIYKKSGTDVGDVSAYFGMKDGAPDFNPAIERFTKSLADRKSQGKDDGGLTEVLNLLNTGKAQVQGVLDQKSTSMTGADLERQDAETERTRTNAQRQAEIKIDTAQRTHKQLQQIDAEAEKSRLDLMNQQQDDLKKNGLAGESLTEEQGQRKQEILTYYADKATQLDYDTAQKKRDTQSQLQADADAATFGHEQAQIDLLRDGGAKQLQQLELNKKMKLAQLDAEMLKYTADQIEYQRLQQEKVDAAKTADNEIARSAEDLALKSKQQLNEMATQIAQLKLDLRQGTTTGNVTDLAKATLDNLFDQQTADYKQAADDYGVGTERYQDHITKIEQKYTLLRQQAALNAQNQNDDLLKKREQLLLDAEQRQYDAEAKSHELAMKNAQQEIDKYEEKNRQIQQTIDLKNQERADALKDFDGKDLGIFAQLKGGDFTTYNPDTAASQTQSYEQLFRQGLDNISNPEDIPDSTYSQQSVSEAVQSVVDQLTLQNENLFGLEKYDPKDPAKNKEEYLKQIQEIAAFQAKAAEESLKRQDLTTKERNELYQQDREAYQRFQQAYRDQINETADAVVQKAQDEIDSNNRKEASYKDTVATEQFALNALKDTYDTNVKAIQDKVAEALLANDSMKVSVSQLKDGVYGPLSDIIALYDNLTSSAKAAYAEFSKPLPTASNPSTSPSGGNNGSSYASGSGYTVNPNQFTSDAWAALTGSGSNSGGGPSTPVYSEQWVDGIGWANVPNHADGALVPPGFPNDTYRANLSSGEAVLPEWLVNLLKQQDANRTQPPTWFDRFIQNPGMLMAPQSSSHHIDQRQQTYEFKIYDANDPAMVERTVIRALQKHDRAASNTNPYFEPLI